MSRFRKVLLALLVVAVPLTAGGFMLQRRADRDAARLFDQVFTLVSTRFVDSLGTDRLYEEAARGLIGRLHDPYAALVSPRQMADFTVRTAGRYGGLGLLLEDHEGAITVNRIFPHTPGEEAGVQPGDQIVAIDSADISGWQFSDVTDHLKGTPGTNVLVSFSRQGVEQPIEMRLTRAIIHIPSVPYVAVLDGGIGYLPLQQFSETSAREVLEALTQLKPSTLHGLVLDLRGNGGGYTDQAQMIANLFLPQGAEIYSVRNREGVTERYYATRDPMLPTLPLAILTDGYSASATEIVSGALQDHDRAVLVGTTTYGKGLVQSVFPLENGWALKLTTGKWYTPSGRTIQRPSHDVGLHAASDSAAADSTGDVASADSASADSARPVYHSDAGRPVYGGGAITPDVVVRADTLEGADRELAREIAPRMQDVYLALYDLAAAVAPKVGPDFRVQSAWRDDFYRRLQKRGVPIERAAYDSGQHYVDRLIETRVAIMAFGDSAARRRSVPDDAPLQTAMQLLEHGGSQHDILGAVSRPR